MKNITHVGVILDSKIDKDAVTFEMLPDGRHKVRIKKEKWGGIIKEQWKTERSYLDGDHIVLIQKKSNVYVGL